MCKVTVTSIIGGNVSVMYSEFSIYTETAGYSLKVLSVSFFLDIQIVSLRKRLERTEGSVEALQQQCSEAMQKAARCSIQHQQSLEHLQQASQTSAEDQPIPTSLPSVPQQGCLLEPKTRGKKILYILWRHCKSTLGARLQTRGTPNLKFL